MQYLPYGSVQKDSDGSYTLIFERRFPQPITRVWQAITDPAQVAKWFGILTEPLVEGQPFFLRFIDQGDSKAEGTVLAVRPETLVEYTWMSKNEPTFVRWELSDEGAAGTRLVLTHSKLRFGVHHYGAGWHALMENLPGVVEGSRTEYALDKSINHALEPYYAKAVEEAG